VRAASTKRRKTKTTRTIIMLKKILLAVVILLAIPLVAALFVKQNYSVEAEVVIEQPPIVVFDYIRFLTNQDNFSVWAAMDPNMQKSYRGVDGTVGFVSSWHSENSDVGTGEQEIKAITDGQRIEYELRFYQPFTAVSPAYMQTDAVNDTTTRVRWGFAGHMPYPMNLMLLFVDVEGMIAADLQQGLENLKLILETPAEPLAAG
jgi:uncharacterized protein YndB with AHSA1/START domain